MTDDDAQFAESGSPTVPCNLIVPCSCHMVSGVHDERVPREEATITCDCHGGQCLYADDEYTPTRTRPTPPGGGHHG